MEYMFVLFEWGWGRGGQLDGCLVDGALAEITGRTRFASYVR